MTKGRLEAFSDGVIAILITIMVLELRAPDGADWAALRPVLPHFLAYVLSFVYLGIYWNNHHHMLHAAQHVNGRVLWANLHLLFWLSLVPVSTAWMAEHPTAALPAAVYGVTLLLPAIAYYLLQSSIIALEGRRSHLAAAVGRDHKGKLSPLLYAAAIGLAFVDRRIAFALYVAVAVIWLVPDRRIEDRLEHHEKHLDTEHG
ncbi:MAG: Integral rane protein [Gemmatimonadetes bacterium]|nr:Integral rane protein [Gemmatimonadota bacterium]